MSEASNEIIERYFGVGSTLDLQTGTIGLNINNLPGLSKLDKNLGFVLGYIDASSQNIGAILEMPASPNSFGFYSRKYEIEVSSSDSFDVFIEFYVNKNNGQTIADYLDLEVQSKITRASDSFEIIPSDFFMFTETDPSLTSEQIFVYKVFSHVFDLLPGTNYILEISSNYPVELVIDFQPTQEVALSDGSGLG